MRPCLFLDLDSFSVDDAAMVASWVRLCNDLELPAIALSGRARAARGGLSRADIESQGARLDDAYFCPHDSAGCNCRLPRHGLLLQAALRWGIDAKHSILVGDPATAAEPAARLGMRFVDVAAVLDCGLDLLAAA